MRAQLAELRCEKADLRGVRLVAVEFLALLQHHSDFVLRLLPEAGQLATVLHMMLKDEFRLLDPLVQLADILPHGIAGVGRFLAKHSHLI